MKYQHILFDLDGTISDNSEGIMNSLKYALEKMGIPYEGRDDLYNIIGPPLQVGFQELFGLEGKDNEEAVKQYREYYGQKGLLENRLYDGIAELIASLHAQGAKIYLATSKLEKFARLILEHFGVARYFTDIRGADFKGKSSDKASLIGYLLEKHQVPTNEAVMIGDKRFDIEGGKAKGIATIGVLYGFGSREELEGAGAGCILETVAGLKEVLESDC